MRPALRASLELAVMTATIAATAPAAFAGGGGGNGDAGAGVGAGGVTVTVGPPGSPGKPGGGGGSSAVPSCGPQYIDGKGLPSLVDNSTQGHWVIDTCLGLAPGSLRWIPTTQGGPAPIPSVLAKTALSNAAWPTIKGDFNPSPDRLLVNFPTWLHLTSGWRFITASASEAGVSATVTAKPESVHWEMGDGATVTCHSAGTAYDAHRSWQANLTTRDCGYRYTTSSSGSAGGRYSVTVTVHYAVTWTSNAGGGGSLGGYARNATTTVAVGQIESLEN